MLSTSIGPGAAPFVKTGLLPAPTPHPTLAIPILGQSSFELSCLRHSALRLEIQTTGKLSVKLIPPPGGRLEQVDIDEPARELTFIPELSGDYLVELVNLSGSSCYFAFCAHA